MPKPSRRRSGKDANMERPAGDVSLAPSKGPAFSSPVSLRIDHYRCRLADPCGSSNKAAIDGLVNCGILRDDSTKEIVEPVLEYQTKVTKPEEECTVITITEVR